MSGKDKMDWQDRVDIVLRGPDGEIKTSRSSKKPNPLIIILALLLFIPVAIYRVLFTQE